MVDDIFVGGLILIALIGFVFYIACWLYTFNMQIDKPTSLLLLSVFGLMIPILGSIIGFWYIFFGPTKRRLAKLRIEQTSYYSKFLKELSDVKFVDAIDKLVNSNLQIANNPWISSNWSCLSDANKIEYIKNRREFLTKYIPEINYPIDVLSAMQNADKDYSRQHNNQN